jgi:tetratricopeptide (TPR) repeat protein
MKPIEPIKPVTKPLPARLAVCAVIFISVGAMLYGLGTVLLSQVYCRKAQASVNEGHFGLAAKYLEKADQLSPGSYRIKKGRGEIYFKLAEMKTRKPEMVRMNKKSGTFYEAAQRLNPLDAETAYRLARVAARLEILQGQSGQAMPHFNKAIRLRPNGISYRYALVKYHNKTGRSTELESGIQALCRIYPGSFYHLSKEPFWSAVLETAAERGLTEAVAARVDPRAALMALSSLKERAEKWTAAVALYTQALTERAFTNRPGEYAHLSGLYLRTGDRANARQTFLKAVRLSRDREKDLENLFYRYRQAGLQESYTEFYREARRRFVLPVRADILEARALIGRELYDEARAVIENVNSRSPEADAYYWLAIIARDTRDWDAMELAAQKATVFGPRISRYHYLFSVSLQKQKKYPGAEKEADLALKYTQKPDPWVFSHRAWIRWYRKNYPGAVRDWKRAARIKPEVPGFYAYIGEGYQKMGDNDRAVESYKKAVRLSPENEHYRKRLRQLGKKTAVSGSQA